MNDSALATTSICCAEIFPNFEHHKAFDEFTIDTIKYSESQKSHQVNVSTDVMPNPMCEINYNLRIPLFIGQGWTKKVCVLPDVYGFWMSIDFTNYFKAVNR